MGYIALLEAAAMLAHCLGLGVDLLGQTKEPAATRMERKIRFVTVKPGYVGGFKQNVMICRGDEKILTLSMIALISPSPAEDGVELGDYARMHGTTSVDIATKEDIAQKPGLEAPGVAVNMIPRILEAPPGFDMMNILSCPKHWTGDPDPKPARKIVPF